MQKVLVLVNTVLPTSVLVRGYKYFNIVPENPSFHQDWDVWDVCMQMFRSWRDLWSSGTTESEEASGWTLKQTLCYTDAWPQQRSFIPLSGLTEECNRISECLSWEYRRESSLLSPIIILYIYAEVSFDQVIWSDKRCSMSADSISALGVRNTDESLCFTGGSPLIINTQGPKETVHRLSFHCTIIETYKCRCTNTPTLTISWGSPRGRHQVQGGWSPP